MVTVDTIVAGNRVRDLRNGLSIPPALTLSTVASVALKPSYWYHLLAGPALDYANFAGRAPTTVMKTADFFDARPELVRYFGLAVPVGGEAAAQGTGRARGRAAGA